MKKCLATLLILLNASNGFSAFKFSRSVSVNAAQVASSQTNFPALFAGTYNGSGGILDLRTSAGKVINANGYDIGFYSNPNCSTGKMNWEQENYNASTGEVEYWINIPSLSSVVSTVFYICYGDATISTDQSNPTAVWDSDFKAVWHMPNGSSLSGADSTGANNGTLNNIPTATAGQIDGGGNFVAASSQYIETATQPTFRANSAGTISGWFNSTDATVLQELFGYGDTTPGSGGTGPLLTLSVRSTTVSVTFAKIGTVNIVNGGTILNSNTWYYGTVTSDGATYKLYLNGVIETPTVALGNNDGQWFGSTGGDATDRAAIGDVLFLNSRQLYWNGILDEVRVSDIARSQDWITTEYNNQFSPSAFYALGSETALGVTSPNIFKGIKFKGGIFR